MNRGEGVVEDGRVRLDPGPEKPSLPPEVEQQAIRAEPPPAPPEPEPKSSVAEDLEDAKKQLTQEDARKEEDEKFLKDYEDLDLMRLVTDGYVQHEVEMFEGFTILLRTLTEDEDQEVLKNMQDLVGSNWYVGDMTARYTLSICIVKVNGVEFGDGRESRHEKIGKMGKPIKLAMFKAFRELNKAVAMKMEGHSGNWLERLLIGQDSI